MYTMRKPQLKLTDKAKQLGKKEHEQKDNKKKKTKQKNTLLKELGIRTL